MKRPETQNRHGSRPDGPARAFAKSFESALESDELARWLDRITSWLLDPEEEARLDTAWSALPLSSRGAVGPDRVVVRRVYALFQLLYRYYFRVESTGHEWLPEKGATILAANHGGLLPFDATMVVVDLLHRAEPPRLARALVDRWAGTLPLVSALYERLGERIATRENLRALLRSEQTALVFPEGIDAMRKRAAERYVLRPFRSGFIQEALQHRTPIVPVAILGAEDQSPLLYDVKPLARLLKLPVFPITPTFPLFGPLGLLPYPVKYEIHYGEPLRFHEEFPVQALRDIHAVRYMADRLRRQIQEMVDARILARRGAR